jgi:hypothetical protein
MRSPFFSLSLALFAVAPQLIACRDASGPDTRTPANLVIVSGDGQPATEVGTKLALPLTVRVTDAQDAGIGGVTITWMTASGTMPAPTSVSDRNGLATMEWTLGTRAGNQTATAAIKDKSVTFHEAAAAGALSQVILNRDTVQLLGIGDAFRLSARGGDRFGNALQMQTQVSADDTSIVTADNFGTGAILTARASDKRTTVHATAGSITRSATVVVLPAPCRAGVSAATLAVGEVAIFPGTEASEFCVQGTPSGAEFIAVPFYSDFSGALLRLSISTAGTTTAVADRIIPGFNVLKAPTEPRLQRDEVFDASLRERSVRELTPLIPMSRFAVPGNSGRSGQLSGAPQIGDLVKLNTNSSSSCTNANIRTGRVVVISDRAIVVADTANPANGFTLDDYKYFASGFDTLVYPTDTANFGTPTDKDGNQHIILFFTRAVNELTPPGQNFYVGGFFFNRDLFPVTTAGNVEGCAASNFAELLYMLVPDPGGVVNQNVRSVDFVKGTTLGTLAHELQHLINSSRHLYVNRSANFEDPFLDEGLSHVAEELVFFKASGLAPGEDITYASIESTPKVLDAFNTFEAANFRRFREFLTDPLTNSPYASNGNLTTRGAIWSFLRYSADRLGTPEAALWFKLANPPNGIHGVSNIATAINTDLSGWVRDWSMANFADDLVSGAPRIDTHPSWDIHSVIASLNQGIWALDTQQIDAMGITSVAIGDGSAAYLRFGVRPGEVGGGRITARAATVPSSFTLSIIRTK